LDFDNFCRFGLSLLLLELKLDFELSELVLDFLDLERLKARRLDPDLDRDLRRLDLDLDRVRVLRFLSG
jgi:hypothetical protein